MLPILSIRGLSKQFMLHEQGKRLQSCDRVSLDVFPGQLTALTGKTGCGKSSVLKCVYRTYLPSTGEILFRSYDGLEIDIACASPSQVLKLRQREIAYVTQFLRCLPRRSALQLVMDPLLSGGLDSSIARQRACSLLERLNIREALWDIPPATFSGGEKQRINLACSLITRPRLLLLDEPTASLDTETTRLVVSLLSDLKAEGVGMLAVFHDPALVGQLADHHLELPSVSVEDNSMESMCS